MFFLPPYYFCLCREIESLFLIWGTGEYGTGSVPNHSLGIPRFHLQVGWIHVPSRYMDPGSHMQFHRPCSNGGQRINSQPILLRDNWFVHSARVEHLCQGAGRIWDIFEVISLLWVLECTPFSQCLHSSKTLSIAWIIYEFPLNLSSANSAEWATLLEEWNQQSFLPFLSAKVNLRKWGQLTLST